MKELIAIFSPQWWTFKNRLFRSDRTAYVKSLFVLLLGTGFWVIALHFLTDMLTRLQDFEGGIGNIIALKGLSVLLMLVFFLLILRRFLIVRGFRNFGGLLAGLFDGLGFLLRGFVASSARATWLAFAFPGAFFPVLVVLEKDTAH